MKMTSKIKTTSIMKMKFFLMTSHHDRHTTTDVKPEMIPGVWAGKGIPHDKYDVSMYVYAALLMCEQTEKMTFSCKDNCILTKANDAGHILLSGIFSKQSLKLIFCCFNWYAVWANEFSVHINLCIVHRFICTVDRKFLPIFCKMLSFHLEHRTQICFFQFPFPSWHNNVEIMIN